jgi:hypothetical protein
LRRPEPEAGGGPAVREAEGGFLGPLRLRNFAATELSVRTAWNGAMEERIEASPGLSRLEGAGPEDPTRADRPPELGPGGTPARLRCACCDCPGACCSCCACCSRGEPCCPSCPPAEAWANSSKANDVLPR